MLKGDFPALRRPGRLARARALCAAAVVIGHAGAAAANQQPELPEPPWVALNQFYQRHGLPENAIRSLVETRDGYLWIATHGGVARFDGVRFTVFDDRQGEGLREIEVQSLAEGRDGSIWIGTYGGGVARYRQGRWSYLTTKEGLTNDFVLAVQPDDGDGVWIATNGGLDHFDGQRFRHLTVADGLPTNNVNGLHRDRDGGLWVATRAGGLGRVVGGAYQPFPIEGMAAKALVRSVIRDRAGALWVGGTDGLFRIAGGVTTHFTKADGLLSDRLYAVHEDPDGNVWIGADVGLARFRDGVFHTLAEWSGRAFTAITSSREGCVWVGSGWLGCLRQSQFLNYQDRDGLSHNVVSTFLDDGRGQDGSVWIGTQRGLARLHRGRLERVPVEDVPGALVGALGKDRDDRLWVGTDAGLYRSLGPLPADGTLPRFARVPDQPPPMLQARVMHLDDDGTFWIGASLEGLVRYRDSVFTTYTTKDGLLHNAVRGIVRDREGNLWVGTRAGLNRLRDGTFQSYTEKDGLPHPTVQGLYLDRAGTLWILTRQGLARLKEGRFVAITARQGLLASYLNGMTEDDRGNVWMSCIRGVFRVSKRELDELADGKRASVTPVVYGVEHGLASSAASAGYDHAVYRAGDGRIWFATPQGASVVDPRRLFSNTRPPPVLIEGVGVDARAFGAPARVEAPPGRGDITINYTGLSFLAPEKVRFRYQLEGYDPTWVDAQNRRAAYYSNIPPGSYTFRVIAANNEGVWNHQGAAVTLRLAPHWYQRWSFKVAAALGVLLLGAAAYANRVRLLKARQRELERRVDERTAELATANRELEAFSFSVSHDLRAPLRTITGFGQALLEGHGGPLEPEARELLGRMRKDGQRMGRLIEDLLALARSKRAEVRRAPLDLSALAREVADELRLRNPERRVELVIAPGLEAHADPGLLRVVMENLLGNAWKFTSKRPSARIEVGMTAPDGQPGAPAVYFVRDDGAGFAPEYAPKLFAAFSRLHPSSEFEGSGVGLATVARLVGRHGGRIWAEGAPGAGATFYFTLPREG
jgi:ligand-binding sensor domain-containing protein/signal transduction histidine kinase